MSISPVDYSVLTGNGASASMNNPTFRLMTQDTRWRLLYPAPYFDPIAMQTLMDPYIMMHWGRYFYDWHPIIHAAINKMVSYPITEFVFDTDDEEAEKLYRDIFDKIDLRSILIRIGLDYMVLGNAYFSLSMPFKRMLCCPECGTSTALPHAHFEVKSRGYEMTCPKCGKKVEPEIEDSVSNNPDDIHPILWDPLNMKIEYDEILNQSQYLYSIPGHIAEELEKGNAMLWDKYPMYMIQTAREKKYLKLFNNKVLHLKRDSHSSGYNKGYGQPLISPVLKYLFHLLVLIRAQDALAIDQILPWTIISPSSNGSIDPAGDLNLGNFTSSLSKEYAEWKKNPMRKSVMPIPVNAQIVGAQGKALMLTPEIQEVTNQILAGMCVPNEFVYGGLQWSGANVSMRMLENQFINYRNMMQKVIDYVVEQCRIQFNLPNIKCHMQQFKMADDVAQKDIIIRMIDAKLISKETALKELLSGSDINWKDEQELILKEEQAEIKKQIDAQITSRNANQLYGVDIGPQLGLPPQPVPGEEENQEEGGDVQHGDLPEKNPPRAEGENQQI